MSDPSGLFEDDKLPPPPASGGGLFGDEPPPVPEGPGLFGDAPAAPAPAATTVVAPAPTTYRVLARKYRPTSFNDLIGQEAMVRTLRNAFRLNRIAHAFMLTGVRGVGKTTTARIIARALNCVGPDGTGGPTVEPCDVCANCTAILTDRHPDVIEMDAASNNGVAEAREIIEQVRFKPMLGRTKVYILDEVHMLSTAAFNALLKTLEEPPPHVKFIFATTELRKVPITVLSRCQKFALRRVGTAELAAHFSNIAVREAVRIEAGALDLIARAADGSVRDGLSLLDQAIAQSIDSGGPEGETEISTELVADMLGLADRQAVFELLDALVRGDIATALNVTERAHGGGADFGVLLTDLLELIHLVSRVRAVPELGSSPDLPEAERSRCAAFAEKLSIPLLARLWQMLLKGIAEVNGAPDRRAAAEMVLIRLCHVSDLPPPGELVKRLTEGGTATGIGGPSPGGGMGGGARGRSGGGAMRAVANGAPAYQQASPEPAAAPRLASFRDVVALASTEREAVLHALLRNAVHLVRFAPPVIEIRPEPDAPRDLASKLAAMLTRVTNTRWTIALSAAPGEPTLDEQGAEADQARRQTVAAHPLVRAILEAFPGAKIDSVHDSRADAYGLTDTPSLVDAGLLEAVPLDENGDAPDIPEFAPPDAEPADGGYPD